MEGKMSLSITSKTSIKVSNFVVSCLAMKLRKTSTSQSFISREYSCNNLFSSCLSKKLGEFGREQEAAFMMLNWSVPTRARASSSAKISPILGVEQL